MQFDPQQYYQSHQKLSFIGNNGQLQLQESRVLVIGAGGLGCPCLQYLAGSGIGTIGIADYDVVAVSNLHRQVLFSFDDIGKSKALTAKKKLSLYNPGIIIQAHDMIVDETNVLSLMNAYDVVVDCTDNFQVRYLINDACVVLDRPLVYGAIHQTEGHVTVFNYQQSPTLRCLFPNETNEGIQSCADIGAYNIVTGIIGTMMANEVVKVILGLPDVLAGKLCQFNAIENTIRQIKYPTLIDSRQKSIERFQQPLQPLEISQAEFSQKVENNLSFYLIDVREPTEHNTFNIGGDLIPLPILLKQTSFPFAQADTVICYCQIGSRSLQAAQYLQHVGFKNAVSLKGGVANWIQ
ncbi:ThiF family adenylyltransferase [Ferruginibacter sp. SUN002]|uniref:ThiF family adenylyltransferase n=1 Tax=Ferruginibacter sp. SUN002 TaxID=2937789 RepID=UPI003D36F519